MELSINRNVTYQKIIFLLLFILLVLWCTKNLSSNNFLLMVIPFFSIVFIRKGYYSFLAIFLGNLLFIEFTHVFTNLSDVYFIFKSYYFDIFLIGLLPFIKFKYVINRLKNIDNKIITIAIIFIIYCIYLTIFSVKTSFAQLLLFFRGYFKYVIVFFFIMSLNTVKANKINKLIIKWFLVIFTFQIILSIIQSIIFKVRVDARGGLIGAHHLFPTGLIFLGYIYYKYKISLRFVLAVVLILIIFGLSEVKSGYFSIIPFLLFLVFSVDNKKYSIKKMISVLLLLLLLFFYTLSLIVPKISDQKPTYYFQKTWYSTDYFYRIEQIGPSKLNYGKFTAYKKCYNLLTTNFVRFLFGYGPNSASYSFNKNYDGYLVREKFLYGDLSITLPILLVEIGVVGVILIYMLFYSLGKNALKHFKKNSCLYYMFASCFFAFLVSSIFLSTWRLSLYNFLFWIFLAALYNEKIYPLSNNEIL